MLRNATPLVVLLLLLTGTVFGQQPTEPQPLEGSPVVKDGYYVLQPGDELSIRVFRQQELDQIVRVRPDGRISAMLLDDVEAAGLTTRQLDERITARYAQFFKDPEVAVIVREFANTKVYVGGEVGQPGIIPLLGDLTAVGAVFQAGGFRPTAKTESVVLLRNQGGAAVAQRLDLKGALSGGAGDVKLQPFDVVYVPLSRIAAVDRFVDQYIRQLLPISLNAGFTYIAGDRVLIR